MNFLSLIGHWRLLGIGALVLTIVVMGAMRDADRRQIAKLEKLAYAPDASGQLTKETWQDRAAGYQRNLIICRGNTSALEKAVQASTAESEARAAASAQAAQAAKISASAATSAANMISKYQPKGADTCSRLLDEVRIVWGFSK